MLSGDYRINSVYKALVCQGGWTADKQITQGDGEERSDLSTHTRTMYTLTCTQRHTHTHIYLLSQVLISRDD